MTLLWLPKRSPKLNPLEGLRGQGKGVVSANKQYAGIEEQVERFLGHLRGLSNKEALHTSGVLSGSFCLRAMPVLETLRRRDRSALDSHCETLRAADNRLPRRPKLHVLG